MVKSHFLILVREGKRKAGKYWSTAMIFLRIQENWFKSYVRTQFQSGHDFNHFAQNLSVSSFSVRKTKITLELSRKTITKERARVSDEVDNEDEQETAQSL